MPKHPKIFDLRWIVDKSRDISDIEIADPHQAAKHGQGVIGESYNEQFFVILYDANKEYLGEKVISTGDHTSVNVNVAAIVRAVLFSGAKMVLIMHCHPPGDPDPSQADKSTTQLLQMILGIFKVHLMDHIILGDEGNYYTFLFDEIKNYNDGWDDE